MVSFKVDTHKRALAVLERVRPVLFAESLGGTESLVTYPLVQTHGSTAVAWGLTTTSSSVWWKKRRSSGSTWGRCSAPRAQASFA